MDFQEIIDSIIRQTVQSVVELSEKAIRTNGTFTDIISDTQQAVNVEVGKSLPHQELS